MSGSPTLELENTLWDEGYRFVAGVDEAGRGCLAGPVVAAAVVLDPANPIDGLQDSKMLSEANRNELAAAIRDGALSVGVGTCAPEKIDEVNILQAALLAMLRAADDCTTQPEYLLVDGNRCPTTASYAAQAVVKGDARSQSIAAASIIAKTTRDAIMRDLHETHPHYGWDTNVGYPTAAHYDGLAQHGTTAHHRQSFKLTRSR